MGANVFAAMAAATAAAVAALAVSAAVFKKKKLAYAIPAAAGTMFLYIGFSLLRASSWRAISVGALAIGAAGVILSAVLFIFGMKREK